MKHIRLILFLIFAVVSVAAPLSIIWKHESALRYGKVYKFRTKPVDPYDAFRGRYVTLSFIEDTVTGTAEGDWGGRIRNLLYVRLATDADGFAKPVQVSAKPLSGDDVITVDRSWSSGGRVQLNYPFNRYYLPEDLAPEVERLYQNFNRPANRNATSADDSPPAYVTVRVYHRVGVLEELYLNGKPVRELIQQEAAKQAKLNP